MKCKRLAAAMIALSGVAMPTAVFAQDQQSNAIEEVMVTGQLSRYGATKSAIPIIETARSISVIEEQLFRDLGALSLDDTLNYTAGVIGDSFGFSTRGDFAKVRGFDAAEYRDGQQVLFGFYNNTRSDVYFLEQVEVLKGPASVLYGKGTPGGIVNAISKLAREGQENEVVLDVGSESRQQLSFDLNSALGGNFYGRVVGLYRDSDTQVDQVEDDAVGLMPSITFQNERSSITAFVEYMDRESDTAGQFLPINATGCLSSQVSISPASFCDNAGAQGELSASAYMGHPDFNRYDSKSTLASLLASHRLSDNLEVEGVMRYKDAEVDYRQAWVNFNGAGTPRIAANGDASRTYYLSDASSRQWAVDLRLRWRVDTGPLTHEIVGGLAYQDVVTDNDITYVYGADSFNVYDRINGPIPAAFVSGEPASNAPAALTEDHGIYVSDQISIDRLKVNLGLRYDETRSGPDGTEKQKDYALSTSVGVLYAFDNGISPYVSYAESFNPVIGTDALTGDALEPREGELKEIGLKYQPEGAPTYITFAYFDLEENNLSNPASLPNAASQQEGKGTSDGVELEAYTEYGDFSFEVNITKMNTKNPDGFAFDSIAEEQVSTWIAYRPKAGPLRGFKSGFGIRYVGENESNSAAAIVQVKTDSYMIYDAMLGYQFPSWDLTLTMRNLTDKEYYSTCLARGDCFPGEARQIVGRAAYRF